MEIAFDVKCLLMQTVHGNLFDGRCLDHLAGRFQELIEKRREVGLELPAHAIVLSLNHARTLRDEAGAVNWPARSGDPRWRSPIQHLTSLRPLTIFHGSFTVRVLFAHPITTYGEIEGQAGRPQTRSEVWQGGPQDT